MPLTSIVHILSPEAHSFARNWQLPFLNQRKEEDDRKIYTQVINQKWKIKMLLADNSKNWQNLPIINSKLDLHNINAHANFGENSLTSRN